MIKKTFKTIKENPKVFLVFFLAILLTTLGTLLISVFMLPKMVSMQRAIVSDVMKFLSIYFQFLGLLILFMALTSIFIWPSLGNYIYEMCSGKLEKGWYGRGLKKGWWRLLVLSIILGPVLFIFFMIINLIFMGVLDSLVLTIFINLIFFIAISVYFIIAVTTVFAENSFSYALGNIFKIGSKYFFKLLGIVLLAYIPAFIFSFISSLIGPSSILTFQGSSAIYWILVVINSLYGVFLSVFILTYSMNSYLDERSIYYPEPVVAEDEPVEVGETL